MNYFENSRTVPVEIFEKTRTFSRLFTTKIGKISNDFLVVIFIKRDKFPGTIARTYSIQKVFLNILKNYQESTCAEVSFLIKSQALKIVPIFAVLQIRSCCYVVKIVKCLQRVFEASLKFCQK